MFIRKMHRTALATAAVVTAALALTACGSPGSTTSDGGLATGKVTLWMYPVIKDETASKKFWQDTEASFEKANPGIDLSIELQTFDKRDAQISAALAAGSGPDVVLITPDQAATYRNVRGLLPVDKAVEQDKDSFYPDTLEAATFDDEAVRRSRCSRTSTPRPTTPRSSRMPGSPLPKTWDDLRSAAPVLGQEGHRGHGLRRQP